MGVSRKIHPIQNGTEIQFRIDKRISDFLYKCFDQRYVSVLIFLGHFWYKMWFLKRKVKIWNTVLIIAETESVSWEDWWTYDGISGPSFWGLINPEWSLCNEGRKQSPVNVEPQKLLYDPTLEKVNIGQDKAHGQVINTGHGVSFFLDLGINDMVNITGGPLSYNYPIYEISLHFGLRDGHGSEHTIGE